MALSLLHDAHPMYGPLVHIHANGAWTYLGDDGNDPEWDSPVVAALSA